jgi:hypothetical protein
MALGERQQELVILRIGCLERALLTLTEAMVEKRTVSAEHWTEYGSQ